MKMDSDPKIKLRSAHLAALQETLDGFADHVAQYIKGDKTDWRIQKIREAEQNCRAALAASAASEPTQSEQDIQKIWNELLEKDDRQSPPEHPEMALITFDELRDVLLQFSWRRSELPSALEEAVERCKVTETGSSERDRLVFRTHNLAIGDAIVAIRATLRSAPIVATTADPIATTTTQAEMLALADEFMGEAKAHSAMGDTGERTKCLRAAYALRKLAESTALAEALTELEEAARHMPRATPAPGGASTIHNFEIEAAWVWANDRALKKLDDARTALANEIKTSPGGAA
jgi:ATP:corrinoid adenosyltransferase